MVANLQEHPGVADPGRDVHLRRAGVAALAIAPGVFQQVGNHPRQIDAVGQHLGVVRNADGDVHVRVVGYGIQRLRNHVVEHDGLQVGRFRPGVIEEFVDDRVELGDVGHHVLARVWVCHAHFGF